MSSAQRKQFEVIREGVARAAFGGVFSGCPTEMVGGPISFAPVENNGGLNPEEFYVTTARLLSKAVTPYRKFDFTRGDVLKQAVGLFEGVTLYANHNPDVNAWKGLVQDAVWDDANTPAGINATIVVDRTVDPRLARGLEIKALRSLSVTIWFNYERSHPDLANFYDRLGETIDGEVVRFIVTAITNAGEVSVVWEGEDPYAKTLAIENGSSGTGAEQTTEEGDVMKLSAATLGLLKLAVDATHTEADLEVAITRRLTELDARIATLAPDAAVGKQTLTETRERAVTLYKAAKGEKAVADFITGVIEKADLATARAFCTEYQTAVDVQIPLTCPKCGEKLSRLSSHQPNPEGEQSASGKRVEDFKL